MCLNLNISSSSVHADTNGGICRTTIRPAIFASGDPVTGFAPLALPPPTRVLFVPCDVLLVLLVLDKPSFLTESDDALSMLAMANSVTNVRAVGAKYLWGVRGASVDAWSCESITFMGRIIQPNHAYTTCMNSIRKQATFLFRIESNERRNWDKRTTTSTPTIPVPLRHHHRRQYCCRDVGAPTGQQRRRRVTLDATVQTTPKQS